MKGFRWGLRFGYVMGFSLGVVNIAVLICATIFLAALAVPDTVLKPAPDSIDIPAPAPEDK